MKLSQTNDIAQSLADYLLSKGITGEDGKFGAVYSNGSVPSSSLPESYIEIIGNGPVTSLLSQMGIMEYSLSLVVNVKLRSDSTVNVVREKYLMSLVEDYLGGVVEIGEFHYSLDKRNLVYSGRDLTSGYSTKISNINVKIY